MIKTMKNELMQMFHHDHWLKIYVYDFMYIDTETITEEDYIQDNIEFVEYYKKRWTTGSVPNNWLVFSYICWEYYELDLKFDEKKIKKSEKSPNKKIMDDNGANY